MKKSSLALLAILAASAASAKDLYSGEEHSATPAKISLATPLQFPSKDFEVDGLRLNLLYGTSFGMYGLDLGIIGMNNASGAGVTFDILADWTEGYYTGLQLAALGNIGMSDARGCQIAAGCNYVGDEFRGAQLALVNVDGSFFGLQTGFFNYARGESTGVQLGIVDVLATQHNGWEVGLFNYAQRFVGLQLGLLNIAEDKGSGLQLGVFNCAKSYDGVQIGLLNVIDRGNFPILPFINVNF